MSLAMYAAPFENDNKSNNKNHSRTIKNQSRGHNSTQKSSSGKVSVLLEQIHSQNENDDNEEAMNNLADFDPIPKPESIGVNKTIERDAPAEEGDVSVEPTENLPSQYARQYYQQYVPQQINNQNSNGEQNNLIEKMNYMIHLLEEQQDQKTNHVTEEIILYSFLGVFVIFVVDSFARVGKYVR